MSEWHLSRPVLLVNDASLELLWIGPLLHGYDVNEWMDGWISSGSW